MKPLTALFLVCAFGLASPGLTADAQEAASSKGFKLTLDARGNISSIKGAAAQHEYLAPGQAAPLITARVGGQFEAPAAAVFLKDPATVQLKFEKSGVTMDVRVTEAETHVAFELVRCEPAGVVDLVVWGPYPTTINKTVGETVGVVRDGEYAVGIQSLNVKTLGGYPENEEGIDQSRGQAAVEKPWGSVLQAWCRDRSKPRNVDAWNGSFPNMPVPPIEGETVVGSKIALFGCPEAQVLETIGQIEVAEGLPHPMADGVWQKLSPNRGRSYLIAEYSEADIDEMLGYVKRANLMSLYHGGPFKSWGHYELNPKYFPNGVAGLKACVEKGKALGIPLGAHTLSNFIQPNDAYVTPVPDPRLAKTGSSTLTGDTDAETTEIPVASPEYFANEKANWMHTVVIGTELVRYRAVSPAEPWKLLDCKRGAFSTKAASHKQGDAVGKLLDHPYKVFFPNLDLQREIARNMAERFNETGLGQMDFDGHEGCLASGQGSYAINLFARDFYDNLTGPVLNGTSNSAHFYWHINSYCNWGEPWYGGFRDSMQEYRINNQAFLERNYLPKMLGWYLLKRTTSLSDVEWMLARAAGMDAGFALQSSPDDLRKNPGTGTLLDAIREWEEARLGGAFSDGQRGRMRNPRSEFHLEKIAGGGWNLYPFHDSDDFTHEHIQRQPGEPTAAQWEFPNPDDGQTLQFKMRVLGDGGSVANPTFEIDKSATLALDIEVKAGQTLLCEGDGTARVYDEKGNQVKSVKTETELPKLGAGKNEILFDCEFQGEPAPKVTVNFKTIGKPEPVKRKQ